ncbi:3'-5' exonuclease [Seinonella peptonophila]|uniref:DNA polymerase I n=1 Tax=Seinonella peptonophila TaxID=112248 RepID=A0A1M4VF82_9BACL|nr:DNA polymerase [Seinonella peptonophila]SHE67510.1 3'-5' exonuclease [Seinonella peptonophila]
MNLNLQLTLSNPTHIDTKTARERIEAVSEAKKPLIDQLDEIANKKSLTKKEQELIPLVREQFEKGDLQRDKDGPLTKAEVMRIGKKLKHQQNLELRKQRIDELLRSKPDNFYVLTDDSELAQFIDDLDAECMLQRQEWAGRWDELGVTSLIAWDTETTGTDWFLDMTVGYSCWLPLQEIGFYLPFTHLSGIDEINGNQIPYKYQMQDESKQLTRSKFLTAIKPYMENPNEGKSWHFGATRFDLHMGLNDGIEIKGCVFDSLNAMHLLNENEESYGLKRLVQKYGKYFGIDHKIYTFEDLFSKCSPAPFNIEIVGIYAILDVLYGWKLTEWQIKMMIQTDNLWQCNTLIDSKLPETDVFLQRTGFNVDLEALNQLNIEFENQLKNAEKGLFDFYNINDSFVRKMSETINQKKIKDWQAKQKERINKWNERKNKIESSIKEVEVQGKTHLKKYSNLTSQLKKHLEKKPVLATVENYPNHISGFSLTNSNHKAYLIYDHLGIKDITPEFEIGKSRSTSKAVLEKYFEKESALKPLSEVSKYEKLITTYTRSIPNNIDVDGRLHSLFDATGTKTGRYASKSYSGRSIDVYKELKNEYGGYN